MQKHVASLEHPPLFEQFFDTPGYKPVDTEVDSFMVGQRIQGLVFDYGDHFGWTVTDTAIDDEDLWLVDGKTLDPEYSRSGCCDTFVLAPGAEIR